MSIGITRSQVTTPSISNAVITTKNSSIISLLSGDVMVWNGSEWINELWPSDWLALNGTYMGSTQVAPWSSNAGATAAADTGISRLGAASLAIGNGTAADVSGLLASGPHTVGFASATAINSIIGTVSGSTRNNFTGTTGYKFQVQNAITLTSLGRFFPAGNSGNHTVYIWDVTGGGTKLASVSVLNASTSDAQGFKWASITPITLTAGRLYACTSDETSGGDSWVSGASSATWVPTMGPGIMVSGNIYGITATYPTSVVTGGFGDAYDAPAFQYTAVSPGILVTGGLQASGSSWINGPLYIAGAASSSSLASTTSMPPQYFTKIGPTWAVQYVNGVLINTVPMDNSATVGDMILGGVDSGGTNRGASVWLFSNSNTDYPGGCFLIAGTTTTSNFYLRTGAATTGGWQIQYAGHLCGLAGEVIGWNSGANIVTANLTMDTGISRLGAASVAVGNGTANDTTGNLSFNKIIKYAGVATVSQGVPAEYATIDLTAQSAALAAQALYTPAATGMFRISWTADITTAATNSSVLGGTNGFQVTFTSPTDSVSKTTVSGDSITSTGNTTSTATGGCIVVYAKTGVAMTFSFDYTSVGVTAMVYELHLKVEAL